MATSLLRSVLTASTNGRRTLVLHAMKRQPNIDHTYAFSRIRSLATTATGKNPNEHPSKIEIKPLKRRNFKKYFAMFVAGVGTYVGLSLYWNFFRDEKADTSPSAVQYKPGVITKVSKTINNGGTNPGNIKLTLYQYATCPFCCKVRAYLDYYGYNYDIVEVNSINHAQIKWSEYMKVPILAVQMPTQCMIGSRECVYDTDFVQLNDSTVIVSALETLRTNPNASIKEIASFYEPISFLNNKGERNYDQPNKYFLMLQTKNTNDLRDEREWRQWVDDKFIHAISPNVYRTIAESYQVFKWFDEKGEWEKNFSTIDRYLIRFAGIVVMYLISKRLKSKYGLKDDVRESFYDFGKEWRVAVGDKFRGGEKPNLADLALYGSIQSFAGCEAFEDLMRNGQIRNWYDKMDKLVKESSGKNLPCQSQNVKKPQQDNDTMSVESKRKRYFYFF